MTKIPQILGAFILLGATSALAQEAPAGPPGGPMGDMHGQEGNGGYMRMRQARMVMMEKSAVFRFKKEGAEIFIKCSADEPTKACVDSASVLIDKIVNGAAK